MANFAFGFGNYTTAQTLNAFEDGFVGIGGNLMVLNDEAVTIAGDEANLTILGALYSANDQAVFGNLVTGTQIFVGLDGSIVSAGDDAIEFEAGDQFISNSGYIAALNGAFDAIDLTGGGNTIYNTGEVVADGNGIVIGGTAAGEVNIIENSGTISGGPGDGFEAIVTNDADDQVTNSGTINGDVLLGGGNDLFNGLGGTVNGVVAGGAGDDEYIVDDPNLVLFEDTDEGIDTVTADTGWTLGDNFENLNLAGDGDHTGVGNGLDNVITGNVGDNLLEGLGGDDSMFGGVGDDVIRGGGGNDELAGNAGDDEIHGGIGDDDLAGGLGNDDLFGGVGVDKLNGAIGDDLLVGGRGDDNLFAGFGQDVVIGGHGDDALAGGFDDDVLVGGLGRDLLIGGEGADMFVYNSIQESQVGAANRDWINDFSSAQGDRINVSGIDADPTSGGDDSFTFIGTSGFTGSAGELRYATVGNHAIVTGDTDGDGIADFEVFVANTTSLSAGDFIL